MAKVIDITDKLNFEERPKLVIKGVEIEINDAAVDMIKIMPQLKKRKLTVNDINLLYETLFPEESQQKMKELKLNFKDFSTVVIQAALMLGDSKGEAETPTTT